MVHLTSQIYKPDAKMYPKTKVLMGSINEMMALGNNFTVAIKLEDLVEFHREVLADVKKELEAQVVEEREERYLSIKQVCELLSIDASTLWRWRKRGYLVPVSIGGKRRYRLSEIKKILGSDMLNQ